MIEVQSRLGILEGNPKHLFFTYDQTALQQHKYEEAGKLVAWSVAHGGPGLKALDPHLYRLMCGVQTDLTDFDCRFIPDADVQNKARRVRFCLHNHLFVHSIVQASLEKYQTHITHIFTDLILQDGWTSLCSAKRIRRLDL